MLNFYLSGMKTRLLLFCLLTLNTPSLFAQLPVAKTIDIHSIMHAEDESRLLNALDTLLLHACNGKTQISEIGPVNTALSLDIFNSLKDIENNGKEKAP